MERVAALCQRALAAGELKPVAVTRWSARLVDPACERAFLEGRFPDDRRRVLVLLGLLLVPAR